MSTPFQQGPDDGVLCFQQCAGCSATQTLTHYACTRCGSADLGWREASGQGTVYATTVVTRAPTEAFRALVPYTLVLVDLDEGSRLMAHAAPGAKIGDRVSAGIADLAGQRLVVFEPARP